MIRLGYSCRVDTDGGDGEGDREGRGGGGDIWAINISTYQANQSETHAVSVSAESA